MKMKKRLLGRGELEIHLQSYSAVRFVLFCFGSVTNRVNLTQTNRKDHKFLNTYLEN